MGRYDVQAKKTENKRHEDTERQQEEDRKLTWRLGGEWPRENTGRKDNIYILKASEKQSTNLKRGEK